MMSINTVHEKFSAFLRNHMLELPDPLSVGQGKSIVAGASPSCCLNMNSRGIAFCHLER